MRTKEINFGGFTLIELLIVIAVLAILASTVVLLINPTEYFKRSRDVKRLTQIRDINTAIQLAQINNLALGSASTVYISLPHADSNCGYTTGNPLNLPFLPTDWSYRCATASNYRGVDGNGWIPINFMAISNGSPLSVLSIDPINTPEGENYYTYATGGSWELTALLESKKGAEIAANEGGVDPAMYEIGTDLALAPFVHNLRAKWNFDDTGLTANDTSRHGNTGSLMNGPVRIAGKVGNGLSLDGVNDFVQISDSQSVRVQNFTLMTWVNEQVGEFESCFICKQEGLTIQNSYAMFEWAERLRFYNSSSGIIEVPSITLDSNQWLHVAVTYDGARVTLYLNGVPVYSKADAFAVIYDGNPVHLGIDYDGYYLIPLNGILDETFIYGRTLGPEAIEAIYNFAQ